MPLYQKKVLQEKILTEIFLKQSNNNKTIF